MDNVSDDVLHRPLQHPDNIRVELTMRGALELYNAGDADISEVYSQPRVAQEAGVRGNSKLRPGWSLDLTMDDPLAGKPWDMGKREVRNRVRQLVRETKPFMLIGHRRAQCSAASKT